LVVILAILVVIAFYITTTKGRQILGLSKLASSGGEQ